MAYKRWDGSKWVDCTIFRRWTGTAWVDAEGKRWTGTAWEAFTFALKSPTIGLRVDAPFTQSSLIVDFYSMNNPAGTQVRYRRHDGSVAMDWMTNPFPSHTVYTWPKGTYIDYNVYIDVRYNGYEETFVANYKGDGRSGGAS